MSRGQFWGYAAFIATILTLSWYIHTSVEPKDMGMLQTGHAVAMRSDKDQEQQYCLMYLTGTPVHNGSDDAIRTHCQRFTY